MRKGAGPNGEDVSVPISASYNHHYGVTMIGASARFKKIQLDGPDDPRAQEFTAGGHGGPLPWEQPHYAVEQVAPSASGHPIKVAATSSNGGEYRKSMHGFPPGYALVVDSPTHVQTSPMQVGLLHLPPWALPSTRALPPPLTGARGTFRCRLTRGIATR